jgi:cytochrome c oxidase subunit I
MIQGQNVTIPAHYHGAIVGVTLALMGYSYYLLPRFGYREVAAWRTAFWQPILYGVGQLMHIGGLGYSGGYGVLRKTAAAGQTFAPEVKVALGIMGLGGVLAIIGGFMFVIVVWRATRGSSAQ